MTVLFPIIITKTYLYSFVRPPETTLLYSKTGVYIIFLISAQKHRLRVLVKTASGNNIRMFYLIFFFFFFFFFFGGKIFNIFE